MSKAEYADQGANAIIYTSPSTDGYIELEPFGPLRTMKIGDRIERTVKYTLSRRTERLRGWSGSAGSTV